MPRSRNVLSTTFIVAALASLAACGGDDSASFAPGGSGGGGGSGFPGGGGGSGTFTPGVFQPSENFYAKCANPRTGIDPLTNQSYPDVAGTDVDEKNWLRSWTHELYLWYDEVEDANPAQPYTVLQYFDLMKTNATTPSGNDKDRFHFTYSTDEWIALSQSGIAPGYGLTWSVISALPPREIVIAYTEPGSGSPAATEGLARGARVLAVDDVDIDTSSKSGVDTLNAGLFPAAAGESHTFRILDRGSSTPRDVTLTSANVTTTPVQNVKVIPHDNCLVGYLLFNDHIATAEQQLIDAINTLAAASISDLVLDVRYNGGGFLAIASELAYMIGGSKTSGKGFERLQFNDQYPTHDPVSGDPLTPMPFFTTTQGFTAGGPQNLPTLNLNRVFVLTGPDTCSASESIINGLRGADVEVIQIGSTTCGKPYGFYPFDNCGTTYFSIQFRGVNHKGFGDYPDGFSPANSLGNVGVSVPGCSVADDFTHDLGDMNEGRLAAALFYRANGSCFGPATGTAGMQTKASVNGRRALSAVDGAVNKAPWLENRILRR